MLVKGYTSTLEVTIDGPAEIPNTSTFTAHVREAIEASALLATLTDGAGSIVWISSALNGNGVVGQEWTTTLNLVFDAAVTVDWPDTVYVDVAQTDVDPDEYLGFILKLVFDTPVTRI